MAWTPAQSIRLGTSGQAATTAIAGVRRAVRSVQPQTAVGVDWGNPITRGLVDAASLANLRSVRGFNATLIGTSTLSSGARGIGYLAGNVGEDRAVFENPSLRVSGAFTTLAFYTLRSIPTGAARITSILIPSAEGYALGPNATNFRGIFSTSGVNTILIGSSISVGEKIDALTYDGSSGRFYENGRLTAGPTAGTYTPATGATHFSIGKESNSVGLGADAITYAWAVWNRALSDAEIKSLSDNPYQIFLPDTQKIWVPA